MNFMRNPDIKRQVIIYLILTIALSAAGFLIFGEAGTLVLFSCILFMLVSLIAAYQRYKKIAGFGSELEGVLYGEYIDLSGYEEGELAILRNQIEKLVVQLRKQAEALKSDKTYLADSIADISHQLKTPITSMNLIAAMLSEPDLSDERRLQLTKELTILLARMEWQVAALLKISRLDAGTVMFRKNSVNVSELIKQVYETIAIPMELREQQFIFNSEGNEEFTGDMAWTVEAISNILKNCMEHTPAGGQIRLEASENAVFTEITIKDSGEGISDEDLPRIFERFYKGKNSDSNSVGIGLALARMIISGQNGTIKAANGKNGGAKFIIRFYKSVV